MPISMLRDTLGLTKRMALASVTRIHDRRVYTLWFLTYITCRRYGYEVRRDVCYVVGAHGADIAR
jgi:hypothetical protein